MIWQINNIDVLKTAFRPAGEPNAAVIAAYLAKTRRRMQPQHHTDLPRFYYLLKDDSRVTLVCIGRLEEWQGAAMCIVGIQEIIGEFPGNKDRTGQKGLKFTLKPLRFLQGNADKILQTGKETLEEINFQLLDIARANQINEQIRQKYQW